MPYIAGYLLKLSVSLSVVYLFYVLVLRRLTFYTWNRWYLLGYSVLAFLIPFVNISPVLQNNNLDKNAVLQLIPVFSNLGAGQAHIPSQGFSWWSVLLFGALIGILLMLLRFLVRYISFQRIRRSAQLMVDGGVKVYHVDKSIIPFSFGKAIFINPQLHSEEDLQQIIHHEFIHVKQNHTIDILWSELLCMLNWYNPFAWMIRKSIRQNLEFIADNKVLENGIDKKHYQYLLLKVTGAAHFSITQQFNFSSLKKRIVMMNRSRSARIQLTRFLFLLPLVTVMLLAFRQNVIKEIRLHKTASSKDDDVRAYVTFKVKQLTDTLPRGKKLEWGEEIFLIKNPAVKHISFEKAPASSGKFPIVAVIRRDGIIEKYDWNDLQSRKQFQLRYKVVPKVPEEVIDETEERVIIDSAVDASRSGPGNPYLKPPGSNLLVVVDGVLHEDGSKKLKTIDPAIIEKINILKGESAIQTYGEKAKGKDGVIEIVTTNGRPAIQLTGRDVTIISDSIVFKGKPLVTIQTKSSHPVALYVVNGIEFSAAEFEKMNIDPSTIESISVLKDDAAIKIYGEKAKNGVIIIELKKPITSINEPWNSERIMDQLKSSEKIVWVINGNTYAIAGNNVAMVDGPVNTIIVNNKIYTPVEANLLFKRSQLNAIAAINSDLTNKFHGINAPALVLSKDQADIDKYSDVINNPAKLPWP